MNLNPKRIIIVEPSTPSSMSQSDIRKRKKKRRKSIARDLNRTPSAEIFSFRPNVEEDDAPTEREIVVKNMAADQLSVKSEDEVDGEEDH